MSWRPTVRLKLTLIYGGLFIAAGLGLIGLSYGLVRLDDLDWPVGEEVFDEMEDWIEGDADEDALDDLDERISDPAVVVEMEDLLAAAREDEREDALERLYGQSLLALAMMTLLALGIGWLLSGKMLSPIRRITAHARSSSAVTLDKRIRLEGPDDELKELADTFDAMLDRLQAAFRAQRGFSAQASHELRTPLAIIRAEAELARDQGGVDQSAGAILEAVDRSEQLIASLLTLARSESTMLADDRLDLSDLVGDVVGEQVTLADQAGVTLDLSLDAAIVRGDATLLSQLTANLIQNAIRYNVPDGTVSVSVRPEAAVVALRVENSGPAMAEDDLDTLFRPFIRGDWARRHRSGGYGLGLAIVRSVATAHRGEVTAKARPGGGLIVTVRLPAA